MRAIRIGERAPVGAEMPPRLRQVALANALAQRRERGRRRGEGGRVHAAPLLEPRELEDAGREVGRIEQGEPVDVADGDPVLDGRVRAGVEMARARRAGVSPFDRDDQLRRQRRPDQRLVSARERRRAVGGEPDDAPRDQPAPRRTLGRVACLRRERRERRLGDTGEPARPEERRERRQLVDAEGGRAHGGPGCLARGGLVVRRQNHVLTSFQASRGVCQRSCAG